MGSVRLRIARANARAALPVYFCAMWLGCASPPPDAPADSVSRFYRAMDAGDCHAAMDELSAAHRRRLQGAGVRCEELLEGIRTYPLQEIVASQRDGRDQAAWLVRVRVQGRKTELIIRVHEEAGRWKIASM